MPRAHDKHADALGSLALKVDIPNEAIDVKITKEML